MYLRIMIASLYFVFFSSPLGGVFSSTSFAASAILGIMVPTRCCPAAYSRNMGPEVNTTMLEGVGQHKSSVLFISNTRYAHQSALEVGQAEARKVWLLNYEVESQGSVPFGALALA